MNIPVGSTSQQRMNKKDENKMGFSRNMSNLVFLLGAALQAHFFIYWICRGDNGTAMKPDPDHFLMKLTAKLENGQFYLMDHRFGCAGYSISNVWCITELSLTPVRKI